ncbi:MAG: hypothetical protein AAGG02_12955 [Cyanobacteria bacterium P01_H01_bin.15]
MARLKPAAYKLLVKEINRCAAKLGGLGPVHRDLVMERLDRWQAESGPLLTEAEIEASISSLMSELEPQVFAKAARRNRPLSPLIKLGALGVTASAGLVGLLWVINLPYPMIRRPVAQRAPMLLMPSFIQMDHAYRNAISNVEQADQLVNQATSAADIELGAARVATAQKNLDRLPVWFLGYEPRAYCTMFGCSWRFTFDEFQKARKQVGRMEARVFQEQNAIADLTTAEAGIATAQEQYQGTTEPRFTQQTIALWQSHLDQLAQLPPSTWAGSVAETKLEAYQRDFENITGGVSSNYQSDARIQAAQVFAQKAAETCAEPPYSATRWSSCQALLQQAISRLASVAETDPSYLFAVQLQANYQVQITEIGQRIEVERKGVQLFEQAESELSRLIGQPVSVENATRQIRSIITKLDKIPSESTVYEPSQERLRQAEQRLQQL